MKDRPKKPRKDFPLSPHASGKWQKKIRGKVHYFGTWAKRINGVLTRIEGDGWKEAYDLYKAQADDLHAGRTPRAKTAQGFTVKDLCNHFLFAWKRRLESGDIQPRTFAEYNNTTDQLVRRFGDRFVSDLAADDFQAYRADLAQRFGPVRLGNEITRVKTVFKFAYDNNLIEKEVRYGSEFAKPSRAILQKHRNEQGEKLLTAAQLRQLIEAAATPVKAMLVLGVNCGFGNHDCALLPVAAVESGWITYPRSKTGVKRRCALWPETIAALREALGARPTPREEAERFLFLTSRGRQWLVNGIANPITRAVTDLMKQVGVHRAGLGFYTLRHVFRTIADGSKDQVAVNHIMGHSDASMAAVYRERIDDSRLQAVADHVRAWLFPTKASVNPPVEKPTRSKPRKPKAKASKEDSPPVLKLFAG
jgi:integrase